MSKRERIDQWSLLYKILQIFLVKPTYDLYFRKIHIEHKERIPKGRSVILAPNHQNALMDALAFVAGLKYQTVFLARADVFKSKFINDLLTFIKILPIYRMRDGIASLQKNEEIFNITVNVLKNRINPLLMFPEGNHGDKRRLRSLVKGVFRVAFMAQEKYGKEVGVTIIPVGIDYSHYQKFRQTQLIIFGEPIEVNEFWDDYTGNQSVVINKLRERLASEMKKVMINIETEEYYELYMGLRKIYNYAVCRKEGLKSGNLYQEFLADKKLITVLNSCLAAQPEKIIRLDSIYKEYTSLMAKLNYRDWVPKKKGYTVAGNFLAMLFSVFTLPLVILGLFNNWPHYFLPLRLLKGIKDPQFHSTAKWGAGFALIIIYYLILAILALILLPHWWIKILYLLTLPSSGIFALSYRRFIIKSWARIKYTFNTRRKDPNTLLFKEKHDQLVSLTEAIYDQYKL